MGKWSERGSRYQRLLERLQDEDDPERVATELAVYGPYFDWVKARGCAFRTKHRCGGLVTAHHLKTVAAGGVDKENLVPLCDVLHKAIHMAGPASIEDRFDTDLHRGAEKLWAIFEEEMYGLQD